jgi:hypothetical protein
MTLRDCYATAASLHAARAFAISRARIGMPVAVIAQQCGEPVQWVQWVVSMWWSREKTQKQRLPRHGWHTERAA